MSLYPKTDDFCRTCLGREEELVSLFSGFCRKSDIPKKIMNICNVQIQQQNGFPDKICVKCIFMLESINFFKAKIITVDKRIKEFFSQSEETISNGNTLDSDDTNDGQNSMQMNNPDIEDLAYDPEYISDEIKQKVEEAFRRKYNDNCKHVSEVIILETIEEETVEVIKTEENDIDDTVTISDISDDFKEDSDLKLNRIQENSSENPIVSTDLSVQQSISFDSFEKSDTTVSTVNTESIKKEDTDDIIAEGKPLRSSTKVDRISSNAKPNDSCKTLKKKTRRFFQCTRCNINLGSVSDVLIHHNRVHTPNDISLRCGMCNSVFKTKEKLLSHFKHHVENHLFQCPHCPSEFVLQSNLKRHINRHNIESNTTIPPVKRLKLNAENEINICQKPKQETINKINEETLKESAKDLGKENISHNAAVIPNNSN